jgi:proteasome alpha subunit
MKPLEVEILVAEVGIPDEHGDDPGQPHSEDQLYHIQYDGTVVDEEGFTVLGGEADVIDDRVKEGFQPGMSLQAALHLAVGALAGPDRTLEPKDLEVAVLARRDGRRAFRRIDDEELVGLLPAPAASTEES